MGPVGTFPETKKNSSLKVMTLILEQKVKVHLEQPFRQVQCAYTKPTSIHAHHNMYIKLCDGY